MPIVDPNTKPKVLWVRWSRPDETEHQFPLDGILRHVASRKCPCTPYLETYETDLGSSVAVWCHRTEMERQVVPNSLPSDL